MRPVRPRKHGPADKNRRGRAPKGDASSGEDASVAAARRRRGNENAPFGALLPRTGSHVSGAT